MTMNGRTMRLRTLSLALALLVAGPAFAQDHGDPAGAYAEAPHGDAHDAGHDDGHHDPTDFYLGDMDGDGTANWLDSSYDGEVRSFWTLFGSADDPYMVPDIGFHALHLFLLILLLVVVGRRPVGDALKNRALGVRKQLVDAARERDEARQRNEELVARLGHFERELEQMRTEAAADAKRDAQRLVERAEAEAIRIQQSAERSISDEVRRAKASIRNEAVELAVKLAESTLTQQVQADDQRRLARQFLDTLTTDETPAHG